MDCAWILIAVVSVALNFNLASLLLRKAPAAKQTGCPVHNPTPDRQPVAVESTQSDLDGLPRFTGALSHLILEVGGGGDEEQEQAELARISKLFSYWRRHPPCLMGSYPSSWTHAQVTLCMLLPRSPAPSFAAHLKGLFEALPTTIKACFHSFEIRHAGLAKTSPPSVEQVGAKASIAGTEAEKAAAAAAAAPPSSNATTLSPNQTLIQEIQASRALFSSLLSNRIKLEAPNHALYLSPDCVPIQPNWLNLVDYQTRPPNEPYWMRGSIFRGQRAEWVRNLPSFAHIGRYAIYNLASPYFRDWYLTRVVHYVEDADIPQYDFGRWEMDIFHYLADLNISHDFQYVSSHFRYTNVIVNAWNTTVDGPAVLKREPEVAIVCGIIPDLAPSPPPK